MRKLGLRLRVLCPRSHNHSVAEPPPDPAPGPQCSTLYARALPLGSLDSVPPALGLLLQPHAGKAEGAAALRILKGIGAVSLRDSLNRTKQRESCCLPPRCRQPSTVAWHQVISASIGRGGVTGDGRGEVGWLEDVYLVGMVRVPLGSQWHLKLSS